MMLEKHQADPRRAGLVRRYHTWEQLHEQTVAEHTWQVIRVLWAIWPDVPRHVIQYALTHDCGEHEVGDPPYPSKNNLSPETRSELNTAEQSAILKMCEPWALPAPPQITEEEALVFKLAEYIEGWEHCLAEVNLGNKYASLPGTRYVKAWTRILGNERLPKLERGAALLYIEQRQRQEEEIGR